MFTLNKKPLGVFLGLLKFLIKGNLYTLFLLGKVMKRHASVCTTYWSVTPYALGNKIVKYRVRPSVYQEVISVEKNKRYLTTQLKEQLEEGAFSFDLEIQEYVHENVTPLDDIAVEWAENVSPFYKVATIVLPKQSLEENGLDAKLSFSVANVLEVHKPLGQINAARVQVYNTMRKFREEHNLQKAYEPTQEDYDLLTVL